jgi:hypothetical protein
MNKKLRVRWLMKKDDCLGRMVRRAVRRYGHDQVIGNLALDGVHIIDSGYNFAIATPAHLGDLKSDDVIAMIKSACL